MAEHPSKRARTDSGLNAGAEGMPPPPPLRALAELEFPRAPAAMRAAVVSDIRLRDVRFHTSADLSGSDARSKDPDYSCVYAEVTFSRTADEAGGWDGNSWVGVGISFSLGRGNEMLLQAARTLSRGLRGLSLGDVADNFAEAWRRITGANDGQLVWMGPEKGVVHQASASLVNAVWDAWAKYEELPLWRLVASLSPAQLAAAIDLTGVRDALGTPADVAAGLSEVAGGAGARAAELEREGVPCYTTATGWAGYSDAKVEELVASNLALGFTRFKMKVGLGATNDARRAQLMRRLLDAYAARRAASGDGGGGGGEAVEPVELMMDANSVWEVGEAVTEMRALAHLRPRWIEEPISPDDVVGQGAIADALRPHGIAVASGEQCQNKVMMKQFLELGLGVCQADAVKAGGLNEWLACALLAKRKGVPMCPHAGGVGLCNMAAHLSCIDFACISAEREGRVTEYVDHLQEHMCTPLALLRGGRYAAPTALGWGLDMKPESLDTYEWPGGSHWASRPDHFDCAGTPW